MEGDIEAVAVVAAALAAWAAGTANMLLEHAEMNEDITLTIVGYQEAESSGRIEPFYLSDALLSFR